MNCAACGAANLPDATTCARCGAALAYGSAGVRTVTAPLGAAAVPRPAAARLLFVPAALAALDRGAVLKRIASLAMQAAAVLTGLWGVVVWVKTWEGTRYLEGAEVLGLVLFQLVVLLMIYALVHTLWSRSSTVARLSAADFVAVEVGATCLRLLGELYAIAGAFTGTALALLVLVSGQRAPGGVLLGAVRDLFPAAPGGVENQVAGAVAVLASFALASVAALLASYLAAELVLAVAETARRTRSLDGSARRSTGARR
jgi:hypothetical protein